MSQILNKLDVTHSDIFHYFNNLRIKCNKIVITGKLFEMWSFYQAHSSLFGHILVVVAAFCWMACEVWRNESRTNQTLPTETLFICNHFFFFLYKGYGIITDTSFEIESIHRAPSPSNLASGFVDLLTRNNGANTEPIVTSFFFCLEISSHLFEAVLV